MAQERDRAARVVSQTGDRVEVDHQGRRLTMLMRGFPAGFTLQPGSRVIVYDEPSGPVARPLVRAVVSRVRPEEIQARGRLAVADRRLEMQASTIVAEPPLRAGARPSDEYEIWYVDRADGEAVDQVIAVRPHR
jgi:hypothetical protein